MRDPSRRLVPRWFTATALLLLVIGTLAFLGLSIVTSGALGWSFRAGLVAMALLLVSACSALVRLLTGRLHRWRLVLGPDTITYRGYRTEVSLPWSEVHGARIRQRGPAGVAIDVKGSGADPVVPITALDVTADQLVAEILRAKAAADR